jgi:hypothetical protein
LCGKSKKEIRWTKEAAMALAKLKKELSTNQTL